MKRFFVIFTIVAVILVTVTLLISNNPKTLPGSNNGNNNNYKLSYFTLDDQKISLVKSSIENLKIIYTPTEKAPRLSDTSKSNGLISAINGGYFLTDNSYAGFLKLDGRRYVSLAPLDRQLSHIVAISDDKTIDIIPAKSYTDKQSYQNAFQTGPLFVFNNSITQEFIDSSANGKGEFLRSFLVISNSDIYLGYTVASYTLNRLGTVLLQSGIFEDKNFEAINLDGGSSTSAYSLENLDFSFRDYKLIPMVLGFKL